MGLVLGYRRHRVGFFLLGDCLGSIKRESGVGGGGEASDERNGVHEERGNE